MFNDRYGLTKAVLEGRKTKTRILLTLTLHNKKADRGNALIEVSPSKVFFEDGKWKFVYDDYVFLLPKGNYPKYRVGEVVAVAQSYNSFYNDECNPVLFPSGAGWTNKIFVKPELMPHQIHITDVRVERLQDISDEDCLKEGIEEFSTHSTASGKAYTFHGVNESYKTPREAYASLIDKVSGKGTWESNPYVFVYDFELVK